MSTENNGKIRWNLAICTNFSCQAVNPKGLSVCPHCNEPAKGLRTVKAAGMTFTLHGSRERSTVLGDRFFHAVGANSIGWTLFENQADIVTAGSVIMTGRKFERLLDTKTLAKEITRLVETGERLPNDLRPPFEIDEARHRDNQITLASLRMKAEK
jgi:hypothetical protein